MDNNLAKYLKLVKMTSELNSLEYRVDGNRYKKLKIKFGDANYLEQLYRNTYENLNDDKINYGEIIKGKNCEN